MALPCFILFMLTIQTVKSRIANCEESSEDEVCYQQNPYIVSTSPAPLPTLVNITVKIKDVISINEEKQSMTIKFRFSLGWYDSRLHVKRSDDYTER